MTQRPHSTQRKRQPILRADQPPASSLRRRPPTERKKFVSTSWTGDQGATPSDQQLSNLLRRNAARFRATLQVSWTSLYTEVDHTKSLLLNGWFSGPAFTGSDWTCRATRFATPHSFVPSRPSLAFASFASSFGTVVGDASGVSSACSASSTS